VVALVVLTAVFVVNALNKAQKLGFRNGAYALLEETTGDEYYLFIRCILNNKLLIIYQRMHKQLFVHTLVFIINSLL